MTTMASKEEIIENMKSSIAQLIKYFKKLLPYLLHT